MIKELERLSASELGALVNAKKITPTEVVDFFASRIERINPSLNAFVYTRFEEARKRAKRLEERLNNGENIGPFAGVPFALKDFLPSKKGWPNSKGGVKSLISIDDHDSIFCETMERAGGIAIGKTNAPTYGFRGTTDNKLYGPTHNPFDLSRNSGGSSGGSAAAVAAGLLPIAEGGDAGGSIRIPASWNNLFGFIPSVGTVPNLSRPDAWAATHPYCHSGGLTKTVQDSAILMNLMMHYDYRDPLSARIEKIDLLQEMHKPIKDLRIAFTYDFDLFEVESEIKEKVLDAAKELLKAGAIIDFVHFNISVSQNDLAKLWCQTISADTAIEIELSKLSNRNILELAKGELPEEFVRFNEEVKKGTLLDLYRFNIIRTELFDAFENVFDNHDIIISPVTCCLPVINADNGLTVGPTQINGKAINPLIGFAQTYLVNFTGHPAASVPIGLSESKLPIGMQVIGRRYRDGDVFAVAKTFEDLRPWKSHYDISYSPK